MEFHERLCFIMDEREVKNRDLWRKTGKHPTTISSYRTGKTLPDTPFYLVLKEFIPDYNSNWLLFEEGQPFLKDNGNTTDEKVEVNTVESKTEAKSEVISEMEKIKAGMIDAFKKQLDDVAQAAMVGLEKLRGVANVRLFFSNKQFVNTQNLQICK